MTRTPSDAARAVEAARNYLAVFDADDPDNYEDYENHEPAMIARALLSLSSRLETAREEMKEECADVADHYAFHSDGANRDAGKAIARRIRSLPSLSVK